MSVLGSLEALGQRACVRIGVPINTSRGCKTKRGGGRWIRRAQIITHLDKNNCPLRWNEHKQKAEVGEGGSYEGEMLSSGDEEKGG